MTKEQFYSEYVISEQMKKRLDHLLELEIAEAIADHDRAILADIDFGYDLEMVKGKIINKSYTP